MKKFMRKCFMPGVLLILSVTLVFAAAVVSCQGGSSDSSDAVYSVTYNGNGNTGGTPPSDGNAYSAGDPVTVAGAGDLARTGHVFGGWNTAADGSGTAYAAGQSFAMGGANVVLYAVWTDHPLVGTWVSTKSGNTGTRIFNDDGTFEFVYNTGTGANERRKGVWEPLANEQLKLTTTYLWDGAAFQPVSGDSETIPYWIEGGYAYLGDLRMTGNTTILAGVLPGKRATGTSGSITGGYTMDWIWSDGSSYHYNRTVSSDNTIQQVLTKDGVQVSASTWNGTWTAVDSTSISITKDGDGSPTIKWFLVGSDHLVIAFLSTWPSIASPTEMASQKQ